MADFQNKLINRLLTLYENSKQSWQYGVKGRVIRLPVEKDQLFKNYAHSTQAYLYRDEIEKDVAVLEKRNLIVVTKDKYTGLLKNIDLNIDHIDDAYLFVKRVPINDVLESEKSLIMDMRNKYIDSDILGKYYEHLLNLIVNHKSRDKYYKDISELDIQSKVVYAVEKQDEDILLRVFSKKRFGDSKFVERRESKLMQLFNEFGSTEYASFIDLLEEHNIVKNKGNAIAKNGIIFCINNQTIDLDALDEEFYFSMDMLLNMEIVNITKSKVITVENLTTFYMFEDNDAVILYLGGFHNSAKRKLIEKIYKFNPNLVFYHAGDIDCGGFEILIDLRNKTGIDFKPLLMSIDIIEKYKDECQSLTENDKKRLKTLLNNEEASDFKEVIEYMLKNNIKLEQESIE